MKRIFATLILSLASLIACVAEEKAPEVAAPPAKATISPKVTIKTNLGSFVVELNPEKAPITVENFLSYVGKKHYDGTVFHRVIGTFMIQGGGFALEQDQLIEKPSGKGIKNEANNGLKNDKGTIAMARTADPNSATAQFFVNVVDNAMLNAPEPDGHGYAVFGKVVEGMEVVEKIKAVATGMRPLTMIHPGTGDKITQPSRDVPTENVVIESVSKVAP
jgi:peptidyl-prolyl cis-trans isomerase A (cyclophilin A)